VLQPLVENAIQHAVAAYSSPVTVIVSARRAGSEVHLAVRDDGPGLSPAPSTARHGIGIANTRARLRELYGSDRMDVRDRPEGGVEALVTLPLRTTASGPV
jgi:sensor histidine kinase YesM